MLKIQTCISGYPQLHIALIRDTGTIEDFTTDGERNETFPKLPKRKYSDDYPDNICCKDFDYIPYNIFGVYHNREMHFLTCNPKAVVTKYHIDSNRIEKLPHSKIPHDHLFTDVKGFQVGKYFWIIGGMIPPDNQWAPMNFNKGWSIIQLWLISGHHLCRQA